MVLLKLLFMFQTLIRFASFCFISHLKHSHFIVKTHQATNNFKKVMFRGVDLLLGLRLPSLAAPGGHFRLSELWRCTPSELQNNGCTLVQS